MEQFELIKAHLGRIGISVHNIHMNYDGKIEISGNQGRSRFMEFFMPSIRRPDNSNETVTESEKRYNRGYKVIFNDPCTILITPDGQKFVSKAHDEKFDEEKGFLMCLAKDNGISHLELKKND